jgi:spore photoproduct lyase
MMKELKTWLVDKAPKLLISGELQEGLAFDEEYIRVTGLPLTHWLIPEFSRQTRHQLVFLTKSTAIKRAIELEPNPQVAFSWSVNSEEISRRWEHGAPSTLKRFEAAKKMKDAGWRLRFRLDPMIPYENWEDGYGKTIDIINSLEPELVTIGALRATNAKALRQSAIVNGRDSSVFD